MMKKPSKMEGFFYAKCKKAVKDAFTIRDFRFGKRSLNSLSTIGSAKKMLNKNRSLNVFSLLFRTFKRLATLIQ